MKKQASALLCILLFGLAALPDATAQKPPRGKELYDLMRKGGLVRGGRAPQVTWLPDGSAYLVWERDKALQKNVFMKVDPVTQEKKPFFDYDLLQAAYTELTGKKSSEFPFRRFTFSEDGGKICFGSIGDGLIVYDLKEQVMHRFPKVRYDGPRPKRSSDWNRMVYARGYDLYMSDLATGEERQLTEGGTEEIMNGRPDWVYPEENDQNETFWWSPDGGQVAFLRFDERPVTQYPLVHELEPKGRLELERYPKAGDDNPVVTLHIVDVETKEIVDVDTGPNPDVYIVRIKWLNDGTALTFQRLNRRQNVLELLAADPGTGAVRLLLREEEECFINLHFNLRFLEDNEHYLWTSERSGWRHIYLYHLETGLVRQLTSEDLPVGSIRDVDEEEGFVYFTGYLNKGLEANLFRVGLDGKGYQRLTPEAGSHRASLAPKGKWFFDTWSSVEEPSRCFFRRGDGKTLRTVSEADTSKLDALKLQPVEFLTFKAADGKTDLHGTLFKPADFKAGRKYPLMVHVYGGPHAQTVRNQFLGDNRYHAEAQLGYVVFRMDNRGTPNRGKAFEVETYLKLGQVDLADQVAGVKFITKRSYVDGSRVGITGGSYGGYMTCMALLAEPDVFHVGVANASVTDWKNYDTIYTERYMQRPQDNPEGYEKGSALPLAKNLKGKLLLIHGTVDNNVHAANTIQLMQELIKEDKDFQVMFYPGQRHGIGGPGRRHVSRISREFLDRHLLN